MKPEVKLQIAPDCFVIFDNTKDIDDFISVLEECRSDLEHQIEMEKNRRNRKRRQRKNTQFGISEDERAEAEKVLKDYETFKKKLVKESPQLSNALAPIFRVMDELCDDVRKKL